MCEIKLHQRNLARLTFVVYIYIILISKKLIRDCFLQKMKKLTHTQLKITFGETI